MALLSFKLRCFGLGRANGGQIKIELTERI